MARTKHKIVIATAAYSAGRRAKKRRAKNRDLAKASSTGRRAVQNAGNAQPGYAPVPASVAALPPGLGPPMSSIPESGGRGSHRTLTDIYSLARNINPSGRNLPPSRVTYPGRRRKRG